MHPQLALLLEIQDLYLQKAALLEEPEVGAVEEQHFRLDPQAAAAALEEKIREMKEELDPRVRRRCEKGLPARGRMLVPVIGGVCYGCFVSIPTVRSTADQQELQTCENCGRFIYILP
jgi:predicted  nucleic acid-binding Zn-ribbon protein